jgi:hypothetical protein
MFIWCKFEVPNLLLNMLSVPTIWEFIRFHVLNEYFYIGTLSQYYHDNKVRELNHKSSLNLEGTHGHIITN